MLRAVHRWGVGARAWRARPDAASYGPQVLAAVAHRFATVVTDAEVELAGAAARGMETDLASRLRGLRARQDDRYRSRVLPVGDGTRIHLQARG